MHAEAAVVAGAGEADEEADLGARPSGKGGVRGGWLVEGWEGEILRRGGGAVGAEAVGGELLEGEELRERGGVSRRCGRKVAGGEEGGTLLLVSGSTSHIVGAVGGKRGSRLRGNCS